MKAWSIQASIIGIVLSAWLAGCAPAMASPTVPHNGIATDITGTLTALAPTMVASAPASPTPTSPTQVWTCYTCGGDTVWKLDSAGNHLLGLPISMGAFYGYSLVRDQVLMANRFPGHGAGPGNVSVSDLSIFDLGSEELSELVPDNVVEAYWAPDGQQLAYILATDKSYEIHWRDANGVDIPLAADVSFTWSVAPSGRSIAFTRESGYGLQASPGLFVVSVPEGDIIPLSQADKAGVGSIVDQPIWSPSSAEVVLPVWGGPTTKTVLARADGSETFDLSVDPSLVDEWWSTESIPRILWMPDEGHLLTMPSVGNAGMGGPSPLVLYRLDRSAHQLTDGRLLAEVMDLIGWDVPGVSLWVINETGEPERLKLPGI